MRKISVNNCLICISIDSASNGFIDQAQEFFIYFPFRLYKPRGNLEPLLTAFREYVKNPLQDRSHNDPSQPHNTREPPRSITHISLQDPHRADVRTIADARFRPILPLPT